jgi:hypothetical protein
MVKAVEGRGDEVVGILVPMVEDAEWLAVKAVSFLERLKKNLGHRKRSFPVPTEAICELAAIIRIAMWQRDGMAVSLGDDFDPAERLVERWFSRVFGIKGIDGIVPANEPQLYARVMRLWFNRCSWSAGPRLGRDIVLNPIEVDRLLDFWVRILGS